LVGTSSKNPQHEALVEGFHPIVRWRFLRYGKIFRNQEGEAGRPLGRPLTVAMSLRPAIPQRVARQQSPPPLHRLEVG
jgi:hypothetical protein